MVADDGDADAGSGVKPGIDDSIEDIGCAGDVGVANGGSEGGLRTVQIGGIDVDGVKRAGCCGTGKIQGLRAGVGEGDGQRLEILIGTQRDGGGTAGDVERQVRCGGRAGGAGVGFQFNAPLADIQGSASAVVLWAGNSERAWAALGDVSGQGDTGADFVSAAGDVDGASCAIADSQSSAGAGGDGVFVGVVEAEGLHGAIAVE